MMVDFSALMEKSRVERENLQRAKDTISAPAGKHLFISHSSQKLLHSCARKFEFRKMYNHPKRDSNLKAELGKALHRGFQDYLVHGDEDKAIWEFMTAYPIHLCDSDTDYSSIQTGYSTLMGIIHAIPMQEFELAKIKCIDGVVRPAIEVPFEITLEGYSLEDGKNYTVSYTGYIDAILFNVREGTYAVVDIKTTQWKLNDFTPLYQFSEQCVPYGLILEYMKGETINNFQVKYLTCQVDLLEPNIQLYSFEKDRGDIEDWFRGLIIDLNLIKMYRSMAWYPRTGGGSTCISFNRKCEFFDICLARDPDTIRSMIETEIESMTQYELDEALVSKTLRQNWEPWVKFSLEVPA